MNMGNTVLAAWVQAIGSILAIVAAIALSWWQQRQSRQLQQRQLERIRYETLSGFAALLEGLYVELWHANCALGTGEWYRFIIAEFDRERFRRAIEAIERAPIHELGNWRVVGACIDAREAGYKAAAVLERLQDANRRHPVHLNDEDREEVRGLFERVNSAMAPVVRGLAYDFFESGPLSEWKEHLDLPEEMIPKHRRPPSAREMQRDFKKMQRARAARLKREAKLRARLGLPEAVENYGDGSNR